MTRSRFCPGRRVQNGFLSGISRIGKPSLPQHLFCYERNTRQHDGRGRLTAVISAASTIFSGSLEPYSHRRQASVALPGFLMARKEISAKESFPDPMSPRALASRTPSEADCEENPAPRLPCAPDSSICGATVPIAGADAVPRSKIAARETLADGSVRPLRRAAVTLGYREAFTGSSAGIGGGEALRCTAAPFRDLWRVPCSESGSTFSSLLRLLR